MVTFYFDLQAKTEKMSGYVFVITQNVVVQDETLRGLAEQRHRERLSLENTKEKLEHKNSL